MDWINLASGYLETFETIFITIIIGFLIAKLVQKALRWIVVELNLDSAILPIIVEHVLYVATIVVVIVEVGLSWVFLVILAVLAFIGLLYALLNIRDILANFSARSFVVKNVKVNKMLHLGLISGKVDSVGLLSSAVVGKDEFSLPHVYVKKQIRQIREE